MKNTLFERQQPGCIVKIKRQTKRGKKYGFVLNSEHVIQNPPKGKVQNGMGVWVKNNREKLHFLNFYEFITTSKDAEVKKKIRRRKLRK